MASTPRNIRISDDDWQAIQDAAKARGISAAALILDAVKVYLKDSPIKGAAPRGNPEIATLNKRDA